MGARRLSPRVAPQDATLVPVLPRGGAPRAVAGVVIALALLPAAIALIDERLGLRLVMGAIAVTMVVAGVGILVMAGGVRAREVLVDADAPVLRFLPSVATRLPVVVIALALLLPAVAQVVVDIGGLPTWKPSVRGTLGAYAVGLLGLVILVIRVWQLRTPAGLTLTPDGLRGIRGAGALDARWDDVVDVRVVAARGATLSIVMRSAAPVSASAAQLGSDPNLVAAVIRYYLAHPAERGVLADGAVAALRRVEEERDRAA